MTDPLEALKRRFLDRCASDLSVLQRVLETPEAVAPGELKDVVHKMSGAAGVFGFARLSDLARRLDDELAQGAPPSAEKVKALIDALSRM